MKTDDPDFNKEVKLIYKLTGLQYKGKCVYNECKCIYEFYIIIWIKLFNLAINHIA